MSFWTKEQQQSASGSFEMGGGSLIPENTNLLAAIDEIGWRTYEGDRYINARWVVLDGDYKGRKVFHKIKVEDGDEAKADRAKRMLLAIDANAGGKLAKLTQEPSDQDLMGALLNKPMVIKVGIWETNNGKSGNWVMAVSPSGGAKTATAVRQAPADDDIPF